MSTLAVGASALPVAGWNGDWVADRLGLALRTTHSSFGPGLADLVGLAVRRNPRRAHLLVSTVLGKHVPTDPRLVYASGALLGLLVADHLTGEGTRHADRNAGLGARLRRALASDGDAAGALVTDLADLSDVTVCPAGTVVLGFAETATALGHVVADVLGAPYLHSTRRRSPGMVAVGTFEEAHSHATSHRIVPADPEFFATGGPLVLVDDELSTGQTAVNTIVALQAIAPRERYVIAALVDLRSAQDRGRMAAVAADLGVQIAVVALAAGNIELPPDVLAAGQRLVADRERADDGALSAPGFPGASTSGPVSTSRWPVGLVEGGRHGFLRAYQSGLIDAAAAAAAELAPQLSGTRILVLGHEELMYAPLRIAMSLVDLMPAPAQVRFSTTTRSPILAVDEPGYAIRTRLTFPAHDDPADGPGTRFAYNVAAGLNTALRFSDIVLVIDREADTPALREPDGLLGALRRECDRVHLVVIPAHLPAAARNHPKDRP